MFTAHQVNWTRVRNTCRPMGPQSSLDVKCKTRSIQDKGSFTERDSRLQTPLSLLQREVVNSATGTHVFHNWVQFSSYAVNDWAFYSRGNEAGSLIKEKLLIGRRPVRNWTRRTISSSFLCKKIHFFLGKSTKNCCHQSCTFWVQYAPNRFSAGASPQTHWGSLRRSPLPPTCIYWAYF